jgi:hypothetical protein
LFFNKYLKRSKPVYIKDLAREWDGFKKWQNDDYLNEVSGDEYIEVEEIDRSSNEFAYFMKKYGRIKLTYSDFM